MLAGIALLAALASESVRLEVPYVSQDKNGCGAAAVAMVVDYWRGSGTSDAGAIHQTLYSPRAKGSFAADVQRYLRAQGFRTFAFRGQWSDIEEHLRKGRPLLVALRTGRDDLHYVVVTGMDSGLVLKHDPAVRQFVKQHRAEFERQWKGAQNWALLAVPESPR